MLRNRFTDTWEEREDELRAEGPTVGEEWKAAYAAGDPDRSNVIVGETVGLIHDVLPARDVIAHIVKEARALLHIEPERERRGSPAATDAVGSGSQRRMA